MTRLDPTHPLAVALASGRERYNAQYEAARVRHDALDGADVLQVLAETVAPLVDETNAHALLDALYPLVLDGVGRARIGPGARRPEVDEAWSRALARCRGLLVQDPARLAAALLKALGTLADTPGADPLRWADRLGDLHEEADSVDALLSAGAVLAWREGLVRLREAALKAASSLLPGLALMALGVADTEAHRAGLDAALARLQSDPWCSPEAAFEEARDGSPIIRAVCGGFRGFGGPFLRPPTLVPSTRGIVASDGDRWFRLHADVFGTAFERIADFEAVTPSEDAPSFRSDGRVRWGTAQARFSELVGSPSSAATPTTLAVVVPDSHTIALLAP